MTKATISKWGNSIAIRLPKAVTEELRLRVGDVVNLDVRNGKATIEAASSFPGSDDLPAS
jgi:antitoxin MazE